MKTLTLTIVNAELKESALLLKHWVQTFRVDTLAFFCKRKYIYLLYKAVMEHVAQVGSSDSRNEWRGEAMHITWNPKEQWPREVFCSMRHIPSYCILIYTASCLLFFKLVNRDFRPNYGCKIPNFADKVGNVFQSKRSITQYAWSRYHSSVCESQSCTVS